MLTLTNKPQFYLRNKGLLFWSFLLPVLLLLPLTIWTHTQGAKMEPASFLLVLAFAMSTAFFLASSQQDMMSKAFGFLLPNLRPSLVRDHILTATVVAVLTFIAGLAVPGLASVIQGSLVLNWSLVCLVLIAYALTTVVVMRFAYASWLPFQAVWLFAISMKFLIMLPPQKFHLLLDQAGLLTAAAAVAVFLVGRQLRSRALFRQSAQRPYISLADLRNTKRMEEFKQARNLHKTENGAGVRPFNGLLQWVSRRIAMSRERGDRVGALVWEASYLALANSILRSWWQIAAGLSIVTVVFALLGYFDSRALLRNEPELNGWFSGMIFMSIIGASTLAYHLRMRTSSRMFARPDVLRAGVVGSGVILATGLAGAAALFGFGHLLAAVLPEIHLGTNAYFMVAPRTYLLGAPLFVMPLQLLVLTLWRNPGPCTVLQQTGTLAFMVYHGTFNMVGTGLTLVPAIAVSAGLWLALYLAWRRRALYRDQI